MCDRTGHVRFALVAVVLALAMVTADAGETLFYPCQSCHEIDGSGNEAIGAPAIAGMDADYVAEQMRKFRDGVRGASIEDLAGRQMNLIASIFTDDEDINAVADFVASMERTAPQPTMEAKTGRGDKIYLQCVACHGELGEGNPDLSAPAIAGLDDWYIQDQLLKFRDGIRGAHEVDQSGAQMRAAVSALTDDSVHELSVYVSTLRNE